MVAPGYYLTDPGTVVELPRPYRWNPEDETVEDTDIEHETNGGRIWNYPQFEREVYLLTFRVPKAELAAFRTLHDAVGGRTSAFYFSFDVTASPITWIHVRKEKDFRPRPVFPGGYEGAIVQWYDYTLELRTEVEPDEVDA